MELLTKCLWRIILKNKAYSKTKDIL